ncbi:MAG: LPS export ABC transporter periplasmic protein LptC [Methylotenera sp.]|uniref:LPS export ABC transporter periplasmic protein LptC n=1 Tax=Methylotenera sp. TaxID=2051956 RepID=UPI00248A3A5C|nr:LPS export ABC transporter periplasmic protein LptC [Methylotenera sp.]MDI1309230.1 LPS export ABC transporter periplasmic protein LptC [Methylotenera sp.]
MSLSKRSAIIFPIVILSVLALITAWINYTVQPPQAKLDGSSRHDPDYIVSNFVTSQTDVNGKLRYKLAAAEMRHFPDNDSTDLQRPRYTQFSLDKPYTQVEALRGYVASDGERVQLVEKVKITRQAFAGKGEMTVETEYLNILPNQDLVQTDKPVVIKQAPKTVIYATGMVYEKNIRTMTLLHKVRAHYEKPATISQNAAVPEETKIPQSELSPPSEENKKTTKATETAKQKAGSPLQKSNTN